MKGINKAAYQIEPFVEGCECTLFVIHAAYDAPPAFGIKFCALHSSAKDLALSLLRFYAPKDCGDHCKNSCPQCQAKIALEAAGVFSPAQKE